MGPFNGPGQAQETPLLIPVDFSGREGVVDRDPPWRPRFPLVRCGDPGADGGRRVNPSWSGSDRNVGTPSGEEGALNLLLRGGFVHRRSVVVLRPPKVPSSPVRPFPSTPRDSHRCSPTRTSTTPTAKVHPPFDPVSDSTGTHQVLLPGSPVSSVLPTPEHLLESPASQRVPSSLPFPYP